MVRLTIVISCYSYYSSSKPRFQPLFICSCLPSQDSATSTTTLSVVVYHPMQTIDLLSCGYFVVFSFLSCLCRLAKACSSIWFVSFLLFLTSLRLLIVKSVSVIRFRVTLFAYVINLKVCHAY